MSNFDDLFDELERMLHSSYGNRYRKQNSPIDINDYGDKLTLTFFSPKDCTVIAVNDRFIFNDGQPDEMVFTLPCNVKEDNVKKTYNDITGIVDVELEKRLD